MRRHASGLRARTPPSRLRAWSSRRGRGAPSVGVTSEPGGAAVPPLRSEGRRQPASLSPPLARLWCPAGPWAGARVCFLFFGFFYNELCKRVCGVTESRSCVPQRASRSQTLSRLSGAAAGCSASSADRCKRPFSLLPQQSTCPAAVLPAPDPPQGGSPSSPRSPTALRIESLLVLCALQPLFAGSQPGAAPPFHAWRSGTWHEAALESDPNR